MNYTELLWQIANHIVAYFLEGLKNLKTCNQIDPLTSALENS